MAIGEMDDSCPRCLANLVLKPLQASTDQPASASIWTSVAIRFLSWIELIQLRSDYRRFREQESTDAWIFVENSEVVGPVSFDDILLKLREGQSPLDIIHESKAYDETPDWSKVAYRPVWSRPFAALAWTISFWTTVAGVGFIIVNSLLPFGIIRTLGSAAYWLLVLGVTYSRTGPHLRTWSARVREFCTRK